MAQDEQDCEKEINVKAQIGLQVKSKIGRTKKNKKKSKEPTNQLRTAAKTEQQLATDIQQTYSNMYPHLRLENTLGNHYNSGYYHQGMIYFSSQPNQIIPNSYASVRPQSIIPAHYPIHPYFYYPI